MTNHSASLTLDAAAIRTKLVNLYARMVADGKISETEAKDRIAQYDAGQMTVTANQLPLDPGEIVAPTIRELLQKMEDR